MRTFRSILSRGRWPLACGVVSLLAGCQVQTGIPVATPPGELPPLMLPAGLVSDGTTPASGGGSKRPAVAGNLYGTSLDGPGFSEPMDKVEAIPADGALISASPQPASFALIVGIERYRDVPEASGARADAEQFAALMRTTFGVPEKNIRVLLDDRASRADLTKELRWLEKNVPAGGRIYFFYSGHGAPDPAKGASFLVPYDGDPNYLQDTAVPLSTVIADLEKTKAKEVIAFADACFSGAGGRSVLPKGARPLVRMSATEASGRVALVSASSGAEISGPALDGKGGLFTHHLIEALGSGAADTDGDGQISLAEVIEWVGPRVTRDAKRDNREQHPELKVGPKLGRAEQVILGWGYATR